MSGETIDFEWDGGTAKAHLARPGGEANGRAVVVVHEWWGLNDNTRRIADRYAAEGFVALAPDLFDGVVAKTPAEAAGLMNGLDRDRGVAILAGAVGALAAAGGADAGRIGATGFCMGGTYALLLACRDARIRASAPFYGDVPSDDELANLAGPVLFIGAEKDGWITPAKVNGLRDSLRTLGKPGETKIYPGVDHAFFNDTRPEVYDAEASADAWQRVTTFFRENL